MPRVRPKPPTLAPSALLQLLWLASPALPVGGFSYSEGLEAAIDAGLVQGEAEVSRWLVDQLHLALARADLAVVARCHAAWRQRNGQHDRERVTELNDWVRLTRESSEFRQQTEQMGRSLGAWLATQDAELAFPDERIAALLAMAPAPTWPVAFALAVERTGAPLREALLAHAFGWAENMVQAAIKAVPLGQSAGQRILAALVEAIPAAVDHALTLPDSARQAHAPMLAILSAQHEAQYSRLFRS